MTIARTKFSAYIKRRYNDTSDCFRLDISTLKISLYNENNGKISGEKGTKHCFLDYDPFQIMLSKESIKKQIQLSQLF